MRYFCKAWGTEGTTVEQEREDFEGFGEVAREHLLDGEKVKRVEIGLKNG